MITFMQFIEAKNYLNRREFLKSATAIPAIGLLGASAPAVLPAAAATTATTAATATISPFLSMLLYNTLAFDPQYNVNKYVEIINGSGKAYVDQMEFALNHLKDQAKINPDAAGDFLTTYAGNSYNINGLGTLFDKASNGMFTKIIKEMTNDIGPEKIIQLIMDKNLSLSGNNLNVALSALKNISEKIPAIGKIFNPSVFEKALKGKYDDALKMLKNNGIDVKSLKQILKEKELDLIRWEGEGGKVSENRKNNFGSLAGKTYNLHDTNFIRTKKRLK